MRRLLLATVSAVGLSAIPALADSIATAPYLNLPGNGTHACTSSINGITYYDCHRVVIEDTTCLLLSGADVQGECDYGISGGPGGLTVTPYTNQSCSRQCEIPANSRRKKMQMHP